MALKPDREEFFHEIRYHMDEVAERGGCVVVQSAGSGGYPGDPNAVVTYAAAPSGRHPVGILLCDVVNVDQSRYHLNFYREQVPVGYKVVTARAGWYTTNMIDPAATPVGGETAYLGPSGRFTTVAGAGAPALGQFIGAKDEDGYAPVYLDI